MDESSPKSTLGVLGLVLLLLGGFVLLGRLPDFYQRITSHAPEVAPDFSLDVVANGDSLGSDSRVARLSDFKGKAVLLDFWATWCEPCRVEIPWLIELQQKYADKGFVILGIALDEEGKSVVAPFVAKERFDVDGKKEPMSYEILIGNDDAADKFGGLFGYPTSILISKDGKQIKRITGIISPDEMTKLIESQL